MRFVGKGSKYYRQLVLSYLIIVVSIAILVGVLSSNYFSVVYNRELVDLNQNMLFHLDRIIDESALRRAMELHDDIAVRSRSNLDLHELFDLPLRGHFALVKRASDYLKEIAGANHRLIDSIHVYLRDNDVVISSRNGLVYPVEGRFPMDILWLERYRRTEEAAFWMPMRTIDRIEP